jgi:hypothetical protein
MGRRESGRRAVIELFVMTTIFSRGDPGITLPKESTIGANAGWGYGTLILTAYLMKGYLPLLCIHNVSWMTPDRDAFLRRKNGIVS